MTARTTLIALGLSMAALALPAAPSLGEKGGTDILHITLRTGFTGNGAGELTAMLRQQGKADVQKLRLEVSNLVPGTYYLFALRDGMPPAPTGGIAFDTDANGEATLNLMHHGNGKGKTFPVGLDPLDDVLAIQIWDGSDTSASNLVLDADLTAPDWLQYLVKRRLDPNTIADPDATGALFMKQHDTKSLFRLVAANLDPNTSYTLAINGTDVETLTPDADGRLEIDGLPGGAPDPFDMTDVELHDAVPNVVLSTMLP